MAERVVTAGQLQAQINSLERILKSLKKQLHKLKTHEHTSNPPHANGPIISSNSATENLPGSIDNQHPTWEPVTILHADEYQRYGRQMIMPEVGIEGQTALKEQSVLIVGVGGLGCPAATYLAGAGVGRIGLVDGDIVETSNLHRQLLHKPTSVGRFKVESAARSLSEQNPHLRCDTHQFHLTAPIATTLFEDYDVILDCTDHPYSRYMISDAAVLARRPLISASALKTEGQLMVLNDPPTGSTTRHRASGFCYRCVFPRPPPPDSIATCGEGGILGPVVGVMGVLMATEAIKRLVERGTNRVRCDINTESPTKPTMQLYSAYGYPPFRSVRLAGKRPSCVSCSDSPSITRAGLESDGVDYAKFCGTRSHVNLLQPQERLSATQLQDLETSSISPRILVDVREKTEFDLAHIKGSLNLPYSVITADPILGFRKLKEQVKDNAKDSTVRRIDFICRFGNDSQSAIQAFKDVQGGLDFVEEMRDIEGGLEAWRKDVDPSFPSYF